CALMHFGSKPMSVAGALAASAWSTTAVEPATRWKSMPAGLAKNGVGPLALTPKLFEPAGALTSALCVLFQPLAAPRLLTRTTPVLVLLSEKKISPGLDGPVSLGSRPS